MLIEKLKERFGSAIEPVSATGGEQAMRLERGSALEVLRALRDESDFAFNFLMDLTAVDWLERAPRFDVIYNLYSLTTKNRLRVKIPVETPDAWVQSVVGLWKSADWLERECFDMFGIRFEGHPDLRRILLYDSFTGHPLLKDYPATRRQPIVDEIDPIVNPRRATS